MFLQKIMICVAFSSVVTPLALQTTNATSQSVSTNQEGVKTKSNVKDANPFNPKTLDFSTTDQYGNYYAYYNDGAFPAGPNEDTYGYVFKVIASFAQTFHYAYEWGLSHPLMTDPVGDMITYLTGSFLYNNPYRGQWPLCHYFYNSTTSYLNEATTMSYAATSNVDQVISFMNFAYKDVDELDFYFYEGNTLTGEFDPTIINSCAILMVNEWTGASLTTDTYKVKHSV